MGVGFTDSCGPERAHRLLHAAGAAWNTNAWSVDHSTLSTIELLVLSLSLHFSNSNTHSYRTRYYTVERRRRRRLDQVRYYFICGFVLFNWKCQAPLATTKGALVLSSSKVSPYFIIGIIVDWWTGVLPYYSMRLSITSQSFLCGSFQPAPAKLVAIVFNHSTAKKVNKLGLMEI